MESNTEILSGDAISNFFNTGELPTEKVETAETPTTVDEFFTTPATTQEATTQVAPIETVVSADTPSPKNSFYAELVKENLAEGDWEDVMIELEEGAEPIALSEIKEITPDIYRAVKEQQKQLKEEANKGKFIDVEGLDETTKKLIELKKAGGDITELLQIEQTHVHPLKGLDLEDEKVHEWLVRQKLHNQGLKPQYIEAEIKEMKESLTLDVEAKKLIDEVNGNYDKVVQQALKEQEELNKVVLEERKTFRKQMTESFRELQLKDSLVKTLTDNASKFDENGITEIDKLFFASKENPKLHAELVFLLTDPQGYNEYKGTKIKNTVAKETINKIFKITPKTSSTSAAQTDDKVQEFFKQK